MEPKDYISITISFFALIVSAINQLQIFRKASLEKKRLFKINLNNAKELHAIYRTSIVLALSTLEGARFEAQMAKATDAVDTASKSIDILNLQLKEIDDFESVMSQRPTHERIGSDDFQKMEELLGMLKIRVAKGKTFEAEALATTSSIRNYILAQETDKGSE